MRLSRRNLREVLNLPNWKSWLFWGGGVGILIALTGLIPRFLAGNLHLPSHFSLPLLSVLTIAAVFEELLIRGAVFGNLQRTV